MLSIAIPGLPPKECSPNARVHWAVKMRSSRDWASSAFYCAVDARNRTGEPEKWRNLDNAKVSVTFVLPNNRRRDVDNLISAFKSGLDSLVRCGILRDDDFKHIELSYKAIVGTEAMTIVEVTGEA